MSSSQPPSEWNTRPDNVALRQERMDSIKNAVDELSESNKEIFTLKDIQGFSNAEVGKMTGLSVPAVKSRALRTRLAIKEKISGYFDYRATSKNKYGQR